LRWGEFFLKFDELEVTINYAERVIVIEKKKGWDDDNDGHGSDVLVQANRASSLTRICTARG